MGAEDGQDFRMLADDELSYTGRFLGMAICRLSGPELASAIDPEQTIICHLPHNLQPGGRIRVFWKSSISQVPFRLTTTRMKWHAPCAGGGTLCNSIVP